MWTTREIDGVARALREVADALAEASSEAKSRDARRARDDDDEADGPALGAVKGATLAGNCAVKLREALERVEAHAGEAFRDVEGATKAAARKEPHQARRSPGRKPWHGSCLTSTPPPRGSTGAKRKAMRPSCLSSRRRTTIYDFFFYVR